MNIEIIGLGHIGVVMLAHLSKLNNVTGIDSNFKRIQFLADGKKIFYEDYVFEELINNRNNINFQLTVNHPKSQDETIGFICIGTPFDSLTNALSMEGLKELVKQLALRDKGVNSQKIYCIRSTIYPGTICDLMKIYEEFGGPKETLWYYLPEFLREGSAFLDYQNPNICVLGRDNHDADELILNFLPYCEKVIKLSLKDSELIKLIFNSWHAVKISFANEIGYTAKSLGLNFEKIIEVFLADERLNISEKYLRPGFAFGGYCLPKDSKAMTGLSSLAGFKKSVISSAIALNEEIIDRWTQNLIKVIGVEKKVLFVGIAFKRGCGDVRESSFFELFKKLISHGLNVEIYDPQSFKENPHLSITYKFLEDLNNISQFDFIITSYRMKEFILPDTNIHNLNLIYLENLC